jgi:hypothetical protein
MPCGTHSLFLSDSLFLFFKRWLRENMSDIYSVLGDKQWVTGGFQAYRRLEKGYCCKEYQVTFFNPEVTPIVRSENGIVLRLSPVAIAQVSFPFLFFFLTGRARDSG